MQQKLWILFNIVQTVSVKKFCTHFICLCIAQDFLIPSSRNLMFHAYHLCIQLKLKHLNEMIQAYLYATDLNNGRSWVQTFKPCVTQYRFCLLYFAQTYKLNSKAYFDAFCCSCSFTFVFFFFFFIYFSLKLCSFSWRHLWCV